MTVLCLATGCGDAGTSPAGSSTTASASSTPSGEPDPPRPSTAEAFRDMRTSAFSAASGRVEGTVVRGRREVHLELEGDAAGTNQHVVLETPGAGTVEVLTVDGRHWLRGDADYWLAAGERPAAARAAAQGWHAVTAARAQRVAPWTLRGVLVDRLGRRDVSGLESEPVVVGRDEVDGRALWVLGGASRPTLWVAADGSADLVRLVVGGGDPTDLAFSRWGRVEPLEPPDPATVVEG